MLPKLVSTIYTYLNAGGYYKTALEIKNAINVAQIQLYKKYRGDLSDYGPSRPKALINFQETTVSADALGELYFEYSLGPNNPKWKQQRLRSQWQNRLWRRCEF